MSDITLDAIKSALVAAMPEAKLVTFGEIDSGGAYHANRPLGGCRVSDDGAVLIFGGGGDDWYEAGVDLDSLAQSIHKRLTDA